MQKKKDDIFGFKLFVIIVLRAIKDPIKYAPLSPKKIFAWGKLNNKKDNKITICEMSIIENSKLELFKFIYVSIIFIIKRFKASNPLKPSIKLAPFITNKKHNRTNADEKKWLLDMNESKEISIFRICIGKK